VRPVYRSGFIACDGKWKETWYFAAELGLMLQLNALHMLEA
jgi:hypothetical protein